MKNFAFTLSIAGLSVFGLNAPQAAVAQNPENAEIRGTPISLNTEGATLYSALKSLFQQAKADFTIVDSLKTIPVTVHLNQPFRIALENLLKATGQPITYTVDNGVYHVIISEPSNGSVIVEPQDDTPLPPKPKPVMRTFHVRNGSGLEIAALLGATFVPWTVSLYPPYIGSNPFAPVRVGGGGGFGGGGMGNNNGGGMGGGAASLTNGFSGGYALPGLGAGFFGSTPNQGGNPGNGNGTGNGGR